MPDNQHLVPMCIVYVNGIRIPVDYEGAFTRVLAEKKICAFDIELPSLYDEGKRNVGEYNDKTFRTKETSINNFKSTFFALLQNYWSMSGAKDYKWTEQ
jgi:hypothetical protein